MLETGQRLPPLKGYVNDVTVVLWSAPCTRRCLKRLNEHWHEQSKIFDVTKSLLTKSMRDDNSISVAGGEEIPLLVGQPIQSRGRRGTADRSDKQAGKAARKQISEGLAIISNNQLLGSYQHLHPATPSHCSKGSHGL